MTKPLRTFWKIWNMNLGFLGIQYSFGLQQTAIVPIFTFLGADPENLPILALAGPLTGLIVQPIVGALSDKTWHPRWGRRRPYFLIGAISASFCLLLMPYSKILWIAVTLLWILDVSNNTAMEPYRAFVADTTHPSKRPLGYLMQSAFTGLGISLAAASLYLFKQLLDGESISGIPYWVFGSFFLGAFVSIASILWTTCTTPETAPSKQEIAQLRERKISFFSSIVEIASAIRHMPKVLWQLFAVYVFQWYGMFCYWIYISHSIAKSIWGLDNPQDNKALYEEAATWSALLHAGYNVVTGIVAFFLVGLANKYRPKRVHSFCLLLAAAALIAIPYIDNKYALFIPMIGLGIGWASMMGVPYIFVVPFIPKERYGVYMGIINMMIVIPMILQTLSFGFVFEHFLGKNPASAISLGGVLLVIASILTLFISTKKPVKS